MLGDVVIEGPEGATRLGLPRLERVTGTFAIVERATLGAIELPALTSVGALRLSAVGLTRLELPRLATANEVGVTQCDALTAIALPALVRLGAAMSTLSHNAALVSLEVPRLGALGGPLVIERNPALTALAFEALTDVGSWVSIRDNDRLEGVRFDALAALSGEGAIGISASPARWRASTSRC